jgi:hypothetical protein
MKTKQKENVDQKVTHDFLVRMDYDLFKEIKKINSLEKRNQRVGISLNTTFIRLLNIGIEVLRNKNESTTKVADSQRFSIFSEVLT